MADFRADGRCADKVLFERKSLSGDIDESGEAGKGTAAETAGGSRSTGGGGTAVHPVNLQIATRHIALERGTGFGIGNDGDPAYTLEAEHSHGVAIYDMTHANEVLRSVEGGKSNTLNARMGTGGNQVPVVFSIEGNGTRPSHNGNGWSKDGKSFTLNTIERHAVYCVGNGQLHQTAPSEKAGALNCMHDQQCVMYSNDGFAKWNESEKATPLKASGRDIGGGSENLAIQNGIRRYTPKECERLQGLSDDFTLIPDKSCSDTARYKALGNGMAQPCADFIIRRIAEIMRMEAAGGYDEK